MTNLETLKQQTADIEAKLNEMKAEIKRIENGWEMKCPYKYGDEYFFIDEVGSLIESRWDGLDMDKDRFSQGNIFPTKQATELEAKRRNLLTRFRAFRDECNGDWKPDWKDNNSRKYYFALNGIGLDIQVAYSVNCFENFGYFKEKENARKAIELFGDEIKELFVDCEV